MSDIEETFPERLKRLRERDRLPKGTLSDLCGLTHDAVGRYEAGKVKPGANALERLADYFDVSVDYLLCRTNIPKYP